MPNRSLPTGFSSSNASARQILQGVLGTTSGIIIAKHLILKRIVNFETKRLFSRSSSHVSMQEEKPIRAAGRISDREHVSPLDWERENFCCCSNGSCSRCSHCTEINPASFIDLCCFLQTGIKVSNNVPNSLPIQGC